MAWRDPSTRLTPGTPGTDGTATPAETPPTTVPSSGPVLLTAPGLETALAGEIRVLHLGTAIEVAVHRVDVEAMGAVRSGAAVQLRWARPFDAAYVADTEVRATRLVDDEHRLVLRWPDRVDRKQARSYVRAPLTAAVAMAAAGPRRLAEAGGGWVHGTVVDVSGAGVGLVSGEPFDVGQVLLVRYAVPARDHDVQVEVRARVSRREAVPSRNGLVRYGIELVDVPGRVEQSLVQAVFHLMRTRVEPLG